VASLQTLLGEAEEAAAWLSPSLNDPHTAKTAHFLQAKIEQQLGQPELARETQLKAQELPPDRSWPDPFASQIHNRRIGLVAWTRDARDLLNQRLYSRARPLISRLVKDYPTAPEPWLLMGRLQLGMNDCSGAEKAFRRHLELAPDSLNGTAQLGVTLLCLQRYSEAVRMFTKAIDLKPDFGEAHFNLGYAQSQLGNARAAIASFRRAIRFNPNFIDPYITLADLLQQTGQQQESLALLDQALKLDPNDPRAQALHHRLRP
jgi:tetratricopeptide (TPR) repeat protein